MKIEQFRRLDDDEHVIYLERVNSGRNGLRLMLSKVRNGRPNFNVQTIFGGDMAGRITEKDYEWYYSNIFTVETFHRLSMEVREDLRRALTIH